MTEAIKCSLYVCPFNLSGTAQWVWSMWTLMLTPVMWSWGRRLDMGPRSDAAWRRVFWTVREWSRLACVVRDTLLMHMSGAGHRYPRHRRLLWQYGAMGRTFWPLSRQGQRISGEKCKELKMSWKYLTNPWFDRRVASIYFSRSLLEFWSSVDTTNSGVNLCPNIVRPNTSKM